MTENDENDDEHRLILKHQDWETTCLIYNAEDGADIVDDLGDPNHTSTTMIRSDYQVLDTNTKDFLNFCIVYVGEINRSKWSATPKVHVASIELPVSATQTAVFCQPEARDPKLYRFWDLNQNLSPHHPLLLELMEQKDKDEEANHRPKKRSNRKQPADQQRRSSLATPNLPPLRLKLVFLYPSNDCSPENDEEACFSGNCYDADAEDLMQGPSDVFVSLMSPYPDSWPPDDRQPWLDWLQTKARAVLKEQHTSYSVCEFLDHHALDYFEGISLGGEGYLLVLLGQQQQSTSYYWQAHNVDSLVLDPLTPRTEPREMVLHYNQGRDQVVVSPDELWPNHRTHNNNRHNSDNIDDDKSTCWLHPCILRHESWYPRTCPICYDIFTATEMVNLDCNHFVCRDCFTMYASVQVQDIYQHRRENPFKCPVEDCRQGIKIMGIVKHYLTPTEMDRVRAWYKDLNQPVSKLLPVCLDCPNSNSATMRKKAIDSFCVVCERCQVQRCEYCLEKVKDDKEEHLATKCKGAQMLKFARRYFRATPELQQQCEARYPWMKAYAQARVESALAIREWLTKKEGQVCPTCSNGVVRDQGCFHIHCSCGAHFCYECGAELFPPFYGTHHCWENK